MLIRLALYPRLGNLVLALACIGLGVYFSIKDGELTLSGLIFAGLALFAFFAPNADIDAENQEAQTRRQAVLDQFPVGQRELVKARIDDFENGELKRSVAGGRYLAMACIVIGGLGKTGMADKGLSGFILSAMFFLVLAYGVWHAWYMKRRVEWIIQDELSLADQDSQ